MLQRCADAGISVKYGRKVLQRLHAVGPARKALQSALASKSCTCEKLKAALTAAKGCRGLLSDHLVQVCNSHPSAEQLLSAGIGWAVASIRS